MQDFDFTQLDLTQLNITHIYMAVTLIIVSGIFYAIGKHSGRQDILISKQTRVKIALHKGKCQQSRQYQQELKSRAKRLGRMFTAALVGSPVVVSALFYYDPFPQAIEFSIYAMGVLLFILLSYKKYTQHKINIINSMLNATAKEVDEIGHTIANQLGEELMDILKNQIFKADQEIFEKQRREKMTQMNIDLERIHKEENARLLRKIQELEAQQFKKKAEAPKQAPVAKQVIASDVQKKITKLKAKKHIMQDFVSSVTKFEWCEECEKSNQCCLVKYFQFAKDIGQVYNSGMAALK